MPELPDITLYLEGLQSRIVGQTVVGVNLASPFLLRSADPPLDAAVGRAVVRLRRLGKRIAIGLDGDLWLVIHLMIAGRLHWHDATSKPRGRTARAMLTVMFGTGETGGTGRLTLTEAGTKRRASLHVVDGASALAEHEPGGLEVHDADEATFLARLRERNHTLKRALTDPAILSGIGNAYSDEILHRARLSPLLQTRALDDERGRALYAATLAVLDEWTASLRTEQGGRFPDRVTAFREGMGVHGRYGKPCPICETTVQRIRYAENETNYCPTCQTDGRLLADRSLSRLLKQDWPRTVDELERRRGPGKDR